MIFQYGKKLPRQQLLPGKLYYEGKRLFACYGEALYHSGGCTEGGMAHGIGQVAVVGHSGNVFQKLIKITGYGKGFDSLCLLAVFNEKACRLQGKITGNGICTGMETV